MSHSGFFACPNCHQRGSKKNGKIGYSLESESLRTDNEFRNYVDQYHHRKTTILTKIPEFDLIMDVACDSMHAMDIGITGGILSKMIKKNKININLAEELINIMKPLVPSDFPRKVRTLNELKNYKSTEFRFFGGYFGPVFFKKTCISDEMYKNFMYFFCAYRLLLGKNGVVSEEDLELAKELLDLFVKDYANVYGEENVSFNVHAMLHITEYVRRFGPLDNFSCYRYENYYMLMRKWIRRPGSYFTQILRRFVQTGGNVLRKANTDKFDSHFIKANNKDNCVMSKNGEIFIIESAQITFNGMIYSGRRYCEKEEFFTEPINSSSLNIFMVSELSENLEEITLEMIQTKLIRFPYDDKFVVMPILHYHF